MKDVKNKDEIWKVPLSICYCKTNFRPDNYLNLYFLSFSRIQHDLQKNMSRITKGYEKRNSRLGIFFVFLFFFWEGVGWWGYLMSLTFTLALITIQYWLLIELLTVRIEFAHSAYTTLTGWTKPFAFWHTLEKNDNNISLQDEISRFNAWFLWDSNNTIFWFSKISTINWC